MRAIAHIDNSYGARRAAPGAELRCDPRLVDETCTMVRRRLGVADG